MRRICLYTALLSSMVMLAKAPNVNIIDSFYVAKDSILNVYTLSDAAGRLTKDSVGFGYCNQLGSRRTHVVTVDSTTSLVFQYRLLNAWSEPDTLVLNNTGSTIYTSPYWLSDGLTLYYASNDTTGRGGLDIYVTEYNTTTGQFTRPKNIGAPFNSAGNDYLYVLDETQGIGYWATDDTAGTDSVKVYKFESRGPVLWTPTLEH